MKLSYRGFTLIELLLVLAILTIGLGLGIPSLNKLVETSARKSTLNELLTGLGLARTRAITDATNVTVCPLNAKNRCSKNWNQEVTIFKDFGRARQLSKQADIIRIIPAPPGGTLYGRTGIRQHFGFRPTGFARASIGHLLWCPNTGDPHDAFQIRINMGGRPQLARDTDGNGIVEDAYGKDVICP